MIDAAVEVWERTAGVVDLCNNPEEGATEAERV